MPKSREPRKSKKRRKVKEKTAAAFPNPKTKPWFSLDGGQYVHEHPFDPNAKPPDE